MGEPNIKKFTAAFGKWNISWRWYSGGKSKIRLPVKFKLELAPGSSKSDVSIGQMKRGHMRDDSGTHTFSDWTPDGPRWWDGRMVNGGNVEWDDSGLVANFEDEPGFPRASGSLYMGHAKVDEWYFDFQTQIRSNLTGKLLQTKTWSMRIDVPNPGYGGMWWSFFWVREPEGN